MIFGHEIELIGCTSCGTANAKSNTRCRTCSRRLTPVDQSGLQRAWAWLLTSVLLFVPANMFPLLKNQVFGHEKGHTILEGIIIFFKHGDYFVATVILVASLVIPVLKLLAIMYIALSLQFDWKSAPGPRAILFKSVEVIGRWSMIDIFVVILLAALVRLGVIIAIVPGIGAVCFAFSVITAMFSANSIDTRLIFKQDHA